MVSLNKNKFGDLPDPMSLVQLCTEPKQTWI
jgi:hypothetical protein